MQTHAIRNALTAFYSRVARFFDWLIGDFERAEQAAVDAVDLSLARLQSNRDRAKRAYETLRDDTRYFTRSLADAARREYDHAETRYQRALEEVKGIGACDREWLVREVNQARNDIVAAVHTMTSVHDMAALRRYRDEAEDRLKRWEEATAHKTAHADAMLADDWWLVVVVVVLSLAVGGFLAGWGVVHFGWV